MTSAADSAGTRLLNLIGEETRVLRGFVETLTREQQALIAGDADSLFDLARRKSDAAARLGQLAAGRQELLAAAGVQPGAAATTAWIGRLPGSSPLARAWQNMLDLAREAHALNAHNGTLIKTRLAHNQQALAVLLAASDQAALYGPDGQATLTATGRRIDSA